MNGFSEVVVTPARSIDGLAVAAAQDQKRILAEERVAADVLAAFDALEQKRVVGVLGDLQERRDRRQQVGHDLLARPARTCRAWRDRRTLRTSSVSYECWSSLTVAAEGGARASTRPAVCSSGPPFELPLRLRDQHVEAADGRAAGRARLAQQRGVERVVDEVVDQPPVNGPSGSGTRRGAGAVPTGRGVDQHVPRARRRRPLAHRAPVRRRDARRACS